MSFVKTLATLAAGFAAAKGFEKYKDMGGMAGVKDAMQSNPQLANMSEQGFQTLEKMGVPTEQLRKMSDQFLGQSQATSQSAMAGLGGLMSALGGGMAAGASGAGSMMDALTGTTAATDAMEDNAKLMIRAMIQAAKADGEIDAEERGKIMEHLGELDAEERAFVEVELDAPVDPMALANDTSEQMRAQVYATSLMTMRVDKMSEIAYIQQLGDALNLAPETRERIHKSMGIG
ncbi:MAG: tellurite resistance TerB family protein [Silicimonas sp.]|nr:tellurite resistance TerB family protein [Silicimonas sp.]